MVVQRFWLWLWALNFSKTHIFINPQKMAQYRITFTFCAPSKKMAQVQHHRSHFVINSFQRTFRVGEEFLGILNMVADNFLWNYSTEKTKFLVKSPLKTPKKENDEWSILSSNFQLVCKLWCWSFLVCR